MKKQALNPYLPSWEYIPDGEPYVFNNRVYIYGSHDRYNGHVYCLNDYVCWSAPVDDLGCWQYEGVIYHKTTDPLATDGSMCLFAPDVTRGPDGRYYLYYVLDKQSCVSVAVCETPAGQYQFYGYVHYQDGTKLGERSGDEPQFDPGVLTEGSTTYLYTGFCPVGDTSRSGAMLTVLDTDMLTVKTSPQFVLPSEPFSLGTGFEGHEFFEAPSIRKIGAFYYLIYSSVVMHELCYAYSQYPDREFTYGGVIISNNDLGITSYKPAEKPMYYGGNNHGSIVCIKQNWYIFYHRHTNGTNYSRQGMAEKITISENGHIPQVEMTSCGLNGGPLIGSGEYSSTIACNLFCDTENIYSGGAGHNGFWLDSKFPRIVQDGLDGDETAGYIMNMTNSATAGFKYFDCKSLNQISIKVRGYCDGVFEVRTKWNDPALGSIPVGYTNVWTNYSTTITIPDGIHALYFTFKGRGSAALHSFSLKSAEIN